MIIVDSREWFLKECARNATIQTCVEIGVLYGDFSNLILQILNPEKLFLIDPYGVKIETDQAEDYGDFMQLNTAYSTEEDFINLKSRFAKQIHEGQIQIKRNYSHQIVHELPNNFFDFVYIDGCHLYPQVKEDLNDYLPKLKKNGLLCGHDYNMAYVKWAVDEFMQEQNFEMIIMNEMEFDFALKRK